MDDVGWYVVSSAWYNATVMLPDVHIPFINAYDTAMYRTIMLLLSFLGPDCAVAGLALHIGVDRTSTRISVCGLP